MTLDQVLADLVDVTQQIANTSFLKRSDDVTNYLSHLPTRRPLLRAADDRECNMFAVSSAHDQTRFHASLMQELQAIRHATSRPDAERLLSLAHAINKISNIASIDERIAKLKQQHKEYQDAMDYIKSQYNMNEESLQANLQQHGGIAPDLTRSLEEIEAEANHQEVKMNTLENQVQTKKDRMDQLKRMIVQKQQQLDQLEQTHTDEQHQHTKKIQNLHRLIANKKALLNATSAAAAEPIPSSSTPTGSSASVQDVFDALSTKIDKIYTTPLPMAPGANKDLIATLELIIQALQDMLERYERTRKLDDMLDKLKDLREQVVAVQLADSDDNDTKLMCFLLQVIHQQGRQPLDQLKTTVDAYASDLGLGDDAGVQAIYGCVGKGILSVDRSHDDSFVQANWQN
ncbi:hypothetical protein BC940DRAFT_329349 [Gongronella butleri]|nr:hypothetical protein BC940DRAFT_329349 [Gongronella butleri]